MPFVLATITEVDGSSPRGVGAKMLVFADGAIVETIGGGVLEKQVIADALACLASGVSRSETLRAAGEGRARLWALSAAARPPSSSTSTRPTAGCSSWAPATWDRS